MNNDLLVLRMIRAIREVKDMPTALQDLLIVTCSKEIREYQKFVDARPKYDLASEGDETLEL